MNVSVSCSPEYAAKIALQERLDYDDDRPYQQYKDEFKKHDLFSKISQGYGEHIAKAVTPESLRRHNREHRLLSEKLLVSLEQNTPPSRLPPDQKLMFDNVIEGMKAQGINFTESNDARNDTHIPQGALILSGALKSDQAALKSLMTDTLNESLVDQASIQAHDILSDPNALQTSLAKVWKSQKDAEGNYLYPQPNKPLGGIAGQFYRLEEIQPTDSPKRLYQSITNTEGQQIPISMRIGFHWNRLSGIGPKQAAGILGGGLIDTTMTPDAKGALPGGHSWKELQKLVTEAHPITMVIAYRYNVPSGADAQTQSFIENMHRFQPALLASELVKSLIILDAEKLQTGTVDVLATKKDHSKAIQIQSERFERHIQQVSQSLIKDSHQTADQSIKEISKAFNSYFKTNESQLLSAAS